MEATCLTIKASTKGELQPIKGLGDLVDAHGTGSHMDKRNCHFHFHAKIET